MVFEEYKERAEIKMPDSGIGILLLANLVKEVTQSVSLRIRIL